MELLERTKLGKFDEVYGYRTRRYFHGPTDEICSYLQDMDDVPWWNPNRRILTTAPFPPTNVRPLPRALSCGTWNAFLYKLAERHSYPLSPSYSVSPSNVEEGVPVTGTQYWHYRGRLIDIPSYYTTLEMPDESRNNQVNLNNLLASIDKLKELPQIDDPDIVNPTTASIEFARNLILDASRIMDVQMPRGHVAPDGAGAIRFRWHQETYEVKLVVPPANGDKAYIYHAETVGAEMVYAVEKHINHFDVAKWLTWFVGKNG